MQSSAKAWADETLRLASGFGGISQADAENNLATLALLEGSVTAATTGLLKAMVLYRDLGHAGGVYECVLRLAAAAAANGDTTRAVTLHSAVTKATDASDYMNSESNEALLKRFLRPATNRLTAAEKATATALGERLQWHELLDYALNPQLSPSS